MKFEDFEEKTNKRKTIYEGKIIEVFVDDVRLPNGGTAKRELVFHHGGVGVIAITKAGKMIFVKQFRKPLEKVILEIPAGKIEPGELDPLATAKRELEEETAYQAKKWHAVESFALSPGFSNEVLHVFEAEELTKVENPLPQDEDEVLELSELTLEEAKKAIQSGLICDVKTIFAVYYWENKQLKTNF